MDIRQKATVAGIVYNRWKMGDPVEDKELATAIEHFGSLSEMLYPLGDTFRLVAQECMRCLIALEGFQKARKERPKPVYKWCKSCENSVTEPCSTNCELV